jgi:hypothetical protein
MTSRNFEASLGAARQKGELRDQIESLSRPLFESTGGSSSARTTSSRPDSRRATTLQLAQPAMSRLNYSKWDGESSILSFVARDRLATHSARAL